jgi:hypothetical protein
MENGKNKISEWKCIDVSICNDNFFDLIREEIKRNKIVGYEQGEHIAFVLQNTKDTSIVGNLDIDDRYYRQSFECLLRGDCGMMLKRTYQAYQNFIKKEEQQNKQKIAKRKQDLIAKYGVVTANKIIAGKLEIGMSKAVCKETVGYATVIDQTATNETWKINDIWTGGAIYLFFTGNKLTRITNR